MEPVTAGLIASGVASLVGSAITAIGQSQGAEAARAAAEEAIAKYGPEMEAALLKERPELADVFAPPEAIEAQRSALQRLQQIGQKGYTVEEEAALSRIGQQEAARAASEQASLRQQFAQRGVGGSGAELAQQMLSAQGQAARESQRGLDVAAEAQRRAFQALQAQGNLAGQMRTSGFAEATTRAGAEDERRRFNAAVQARKAEQQLVSRVGVPQTAGRGLQAVGGGLYGAGQTGLGVIGDMWQDQERRRQQQQAAGAGQPEVK